MRYPLSTFRKGRIISMSDFEDKCRGVDPCEEDTGRRDMRRVGLSRSPDVQWPILRLSQTIG